MAIESTLVLAAGASAIVGIILAVWVFARIIDIRDRRRARYRAAWSWGRGGPPDVTDPDISVKIDKIRKGYHVSFYDAYGQHFYSIDLEKVDTSVDEPRRSS